MLRRQENPFVDTGYPVLVSPFLGNFSLLLRGSYRYGTDVRFALVTFMPLAILAGLGGKVLSDWLMALQKAIQRGKGEHGNGEASPLERGSRLSNRYTGTLVFLVLVFSCLPFLPMIRTIGQEAWGARFDHRYAREFSEKIPDRSIVLTHNPQCSSCGGKTPFRPTSR